MNKSSQYCMALIKMKIQETKGSKVPKKFFKKPNVSGLALHQWQMKDVQITRQQPLRERKYTFVEEAEHAQ